MTIRIRLLIIMLITALVPLIVTSLAHQVSIRVAKDRLYEKTREALDQTARQALQEQLRGHVEVLNRDRQLAQALLQRQVREAELAFSTIPTGRAVWDRSANTFGFDPDVSVAREAMHRTFQDANDPNIIKLGIDYQRQSCFISPRMDPNEIVLTLSKLAPLTHVYHDIYIQAPKGVLWLSTSLNEGLMTRYPAGGSLERPRREPERPSRPRGRRPEFRDPDGRPPERGGRPGRPRLPGQLPTMVDPTTGHVVVSMAEPIHAPDGTIVGMTAMTRTIPEIFENMALPERWGTGTERMLILVDPNAATEESVRILLHENLDEEARVRGRSRWRRHWIFPGRLRSDNTLLFEGMIEDITEGRAGIEKMEFKGRTCLWAYQPLSIAQAAALLIVPYDRVTELAQTMERSLFRESLFWLEATSIVIVLAALGAIVVAVVKARSLTEPIGSLIAGGKRLASGDYDARVHIITEDEIGQLGMVFNTIGPRLREHQNMKRSLELARAIQQSLLPDHVPTLKNFEVAGRCLYCDETGGDYYDFIGLDGTQSHSLGLAVGDVSGHGIGPALLMASIRGIIRAEVDHCPDDPVHVLRRLNHQIIEDTEDDKFVTLFYGLLDDRMRSLTWASAGHEPAAWYRQATGHIEELANTGLPLGVVDTEDFGQLGPVVLAPGDILVIGTDGIWEARNEQGEFFGRERFCSIIRGHAHESADALCSAIIQNVTKFIRSADRTDDITLVVVKSLSGRA